MTKVYIFVFIYLFIIYFYSILERKFDHSAGRKFGVDDIDRTNSIGGRQTCAAVMPTATNRHCASRLQTTNTDTDVHGGEIEDNLLCCSEESFQQCGISYCVQKVGICWLRLPIRRI